MLNSIGSGFEAAFFISMKAVLIVGWFAVIFIAERLSPAAPPPKTKQRLLSNVVLWALLLIASPLIVLPLTAFAATHPLWVRPDELAFWPMLIADIILLDLWIYWLHRSYHEIPFLWRFHAPHHLDEHLDSTTAVRFHFGEVVLSAALRMAPIVVLAIPFTHVVIFESILLAGSLFHHSNLRLPAGVERAISRLIVTPSIHWVHHHADWRDTNSNYATVFSLWDPLFGTRSRNERKRTMKIGVQGFEDRPVLRLLVTPFLT
ncbi:MAG: sterol desaturase family protein, partial [Parvularculaceae bacterium]